MAVNSRLPGFYTLSPRERFDKVLQARGIDTEGDRGRPYRRRGTAPTL